MQRQTIANFGFERFGIDANGLCVSRHRTDGNLQIVDRHQIRRAMIEQARKIHRIAVMRHDDATLNTTADDVVLHAREAQALNFLGELRVVSVRRRADV